MTVPVTQITESGPVVPGYDDVYNAIVADFQSIFGSDVYIAPDSQDGQMLAIFAQAISDLNQQAANVYYQFSPQTATGVGLDSVVKVNGIRRASATSSIATVDLIGQGNTIINAGVVGDDLNLGTQWSVPSGTVIPAGGLITVTVTSLTLGSVIVPAGHISRIIGGSTSGWQKAQNSSLPTPGAPIETDPALRERQSISVSLPSLTPLGAIVGAILALDGVIRVQPYENDTDTWDSNGIPEHSISMVVEGGVVTDIATAIAAKKNPGTGTYGSTTTIVIDPAGVANTINYMQLVLVAVQVTVYVRTLTGFATTTGALIQECVAAFISDLSIGETSYISRLYAPANLSGDVCTITTGLTQSQLDTLADTYVISAIVQSRAPLVLTTVTGGPYSAGATNIAVNSTVHLYTGSTVIITLDDSSTFTPAITVTGPTVLTIAPGVPAGRQILAGAPVQGIANAFVAQVAGGPYAAGVATISVVNASKMYAAMPVQIVLDNNSLYSTTVNSISGTTVVLANGAPGGRSILTNALIYAASDVACLFYEGCTAVSANIALVIS